MAEIFIEESGDARRVGKILCIGRNYASHAAEMGGSVPSEPWVFLKPSSALIPSGSSVVIPAQSNDVHHELELVALIGSKARRVLADEALDLVEAYAVGLDMTARDLQQKAKDAGRPWSVAKGFDTFAPVGPFIPAARIRDPQAIDLRLSVNGELRQHGRTDRMLFSVAELISFCSGIFTLEPGDLLFTGTPEGVGPVKDGDILLAEGTGIPRLDVSVRRA